MAGTLGTLVTIVTADVSGFEAKMATAAQGAQAFEAKATEGVRVVSKSMGGLGADVGRLGQSFTSLSGLLRVGFGIGGARALFSGIHEGLGNFVSGASEAMKAGEGYFASLEEGAKHVFGIKTNVEKLNEAIKENAELSKKLGDLHQGVGAFGKMAETPDGKGTFEEADKKLDELFKKTQDLNKEAAEGRNKIAALTANKAESNAGRYFEGYVFGRPDFDSKIKEATQANARKEVAAQEAEDTLTQARDKHAKALQRITERLIKEGADEELAESEKAAASAIDDGIKRWHQTLGDIDETLSAYGAHQKELAASEKENAKDREEERKKALKDQLQTGGVSASSDARNMLQSAILTTKMDPNAANKTEQEEQTKRLKAIDDNGIKIRNMEMFALGAPA